jgi:hypothetical protein
MNGVANGIAHVSFRGGGLFLPARTPYDRQLLAEHVAARVRCSGQVQVLLEDQRWLVSRSSPRGSARCGRCGVALIASCSAAAGDDAWCLTCALVDGERAAQWPGERRHVG